MHAIPYSLLRSHELDSLPSFEEIIFGWWEFEKKERTNKEAQSITTQKTQTQTWEGKERENGEEGESKK